MEFTDSPRIVFMGTAGFAVPSLNQLISEGFKPVAVVTGPDRRRGRGRRMSVTPVKEAAMAADIDVILQPENIKDPEFAEAVAGLEPDIIIVVAFRILPPAVYETAKRGAFNLHGSILPAYRGAAPINRAVMAGEERTGVTTFFLEKKVDTGNIILQREMTIGPNETAGEVHDRMMLLGAEAVLETVKMILEETVSTSSQDERLATRAPKIFKEDCKIDWSLPAIQVHNHIRGLSPYPGAWTTHDGHLLKILGTELVDREGTSGLVLSSNDELIVGCHNGAVRVLEIQQEGRRRLPAADFLRGYQLEIGERFLP